jgi:hypothetical protein
VIVALGVPLRWSDAGPLDLAPLLSMIAAVVIARFLLGVRMTALTFALCLAIGAAWSSAVSRWGWTIPSLAATVLMLGASVWIETRRAG